jgi:uncharacterized membrane protein (DUF485 family)
MSSIPATCKNCLQREVVADGGEYCPVCAQPEVQALNKVEAADDKRPTITFFVVFIMIAAAIAFSMWYLAVPKALALVTPLLF